MYLSYIKKHFSDTLPEGTYEVSFEQRIYIRKTGARVYKENNNVQSKEHTITSWVAVVVINNTEYTQFSAMYPYDVPRTEKITLHRY